MKPGNGGKTRAGDFVHKLPMGIEAQATGKFMPADAPPLAPAHGQNNHEWVSLWRPTIPIG